MFISRVRCALKQWETGIKNRVFLCLIEFFYAISFVFTLSLSHTRKPIYENKHSPGHCFFENSKNYGNVLFVNTIQIVCKRYIWEFVVYFRVAHRSYLEVWIETCAMQRCQVFHALRKYNIFLERVSRFIEATHYVIDLDGLIGKWIDSISSRWSSVVALKKRDLSFLSVCLWCPGESRNWLKRGVLRQRPNGTRNRKEANEMCGK